MGPKEANSSDKGEVGALSLKEVASKVVESSHFAPHMAAHLEERARSHLFETQVRMRQPLLLTYLAVREGALGGSSTRDDSE